MSMSEKTISTRLQCELITTTDTVQIECLQAGEQHAETILFIPGLGANLEQFRPQVTHFSADYHTLAVSLRGHGASTCPPDPAEDDFAFEKLATDMQRVLEHLEIDAAHIVGNSTGGVVGYQLLAQAPQVVRSLTTFGTAGEIHAGLMGQLVVLLDRLLGPRGEAWIAQRTVSENDAVAEQIGNMVRETAKPAIVNLRRHLVDYNYLPTLQAHPEIPVLLIRGGKDSEINNMLDSTLDTLHQRDNARVIRIEGAGHIANLDQPAAFNEALRDFLAYAARRT